LLAGLAVALSIALQPVLLFGVAAAAEFYAATGDYGYAAQLATVARNHVASAATTKQQANSVLAQVTQQRAPEIHDHVLQGEPTAGVEAVAQQLVAKLARDDGVSSQISQLESSQEVYEPLSERELQVLRLVADGKSNRQIGRELYLALGTVKSHLHHIFQKLDVQSRTQAVARALELRIL
jgi:LuxR family maltose regulon positive regulatory protein